MESATQYIVTAATTTPWGGEAVHVTAQLATAAGTPVLQSGRAVHWLSSGGGHFSASVTQTDANGLATVTFTPVTSSGAVHLVTAIDAELASITGTSAPIITQMAPFITTWKTNNPGTSGSNQITIPTTGGGYNYQVRWVQVGNPENQGSAGPFTGNATITFPISGIYKVSIWGDFPAIYFNSSGDRDKLLTIEQWGEITWLSMESAFAGARRLEYKATDAPDLSRVTNMSGMFNGATAFNADLSSWDVSHVTNMSNLFNGATAFNGNLSTWDVSQVVYMDGMFAGATAFNQNISSWHVGSVTNMSWMFNNTSFNQPLGSWDVSQVSYMSSMFAGASAFNQDLSNWDVSNVTDMSYLFDGARAFDQDLSQWDVSSVQGMESMFRGALSFNQTLGSWHVSSVLYMDNMLDNAGLSTLNYDATLAGWAGLPLLNTDVTLGAAGRNYCDSSAARQTLVTTYSWTINGDSYLCTPARYVVTVADTAPWGGQGVTVTAQLASIGGTPVAEAGRTVHWSATNGGHFTAATTTTDANGSATVTFIPATTAASSHVITATDAMIPAIAGESATITTTYAPFITTWQSDNAGVSASNQITIPTTGVGYNYYVSWIQVGEPTNNGSAGPFTGDATITFTTPGTYTVRIAGSFPRLYINSAGDQLKLLSIVQWGDIAWTSMQAAFAGASNLIYNATDSPDLSHVTDMSQMFKGATAFNADLSSWDVSGVVDLSGMFASASAFNQSLGSWSVGNVTNMAGLFDGAGLSSANYEATLTGWAALPTLQRFVSLGATGLTYCDSHPVRTKLIAEYNWSIVGDAFVCIPVQYLVTVDDPTPTSGATVTLHAQLASAGGTAVPEAGRTVQWVATHGGNLSASATNTDSNGIATVNFTTATIANTQHIVTATDGAGTQGQSLPIITQPGAPAKYVVTVSETAPLSGTDVIVIAQVVDEYGNPVAEGGRVINWAATNGGTFSATQTATNAFGLASVTFTTATLTGTAHIVTASDALDATVMGVSPLLTTQTGPPARYVVTVDDSEPLRGAAVTLRAQLTDQHANPIAQAGRTVQWTATFGGSLSASESLTDAAGVALVTLDTAATAGVTHTVTATDASDVSITGDSAPITTQMAPFITTWKTDNPGISAGNQISIPTIGSGYNYRVRWIQVGNPANQGTVGPFTGNATITLPTNGTYEVHIWGDFPRLYINSVGDRYKLLTIEQWGEIAWASMENAFAGAGYLTYKATDAPDLSQVTSMRGMFSGATSFNGDLNSWDVSHVTQMANLFDRAVTFNGNLSSWDVSQVQDMSGMFAYAAAFNQDLKDWQVGNVTNMAAMFNSTAFNQDIGGWDVSAVQSMHGMFAYASAFNQNLGDWDVAQVTDMAYMFDGASAFNQDLSQWDVGQVTDMSYMFRNATAFNQSLGNWNVSQVMWMHGMLDTTGLSTFHYDATLTGWATLPQLRDFVLLGASGHNYCDSSNARQALLEQYGWTINDAGFKCIPQRYLVAVDDTQPVSGQDVILHAQLASIGGTPIAAAGRTVHWIQSSSGGNDGSFAAAATQTDAQGIATVSFTTATVADTQHVVTATDGTDASIAGVSPLITTQADSPAQYLVSVDEATPISGTDVVISAQLADQYGNPVREAGRTVHWSATNGGSFTAGTSITDASGIATVTFTSATLAHTAHVVTATDETDATITGTSATITTQVGAPTQYLLSVSDLTPVSGTAVTIQAQLADQYGNWVLEAGRTVNWTATNGGGFSTTSSATSAAGIATINFMTATLAGTTHVVTATDAADAGIVGQSATITTQVGAAAQYLVSVATTTPVSGSEMIIQAQLADQYRNPISAAGQLVQWSASNGGSFSAAVTSTDASGLATVTFTTATVAATTHVVTATDAADDTITGQSPLLTTQPDVPAQYLVTVSQSTPIAGHDITVQAQLADQYANPIAQAARLVHWSATHGGSFSAGATATDAQGQATVIFTTAQTTNAVQVVTATDATDASITGASPAITLKSPIYLGANGTWLGGVNLIRAADGVMAATVTVQLKDHYDQDWPEAGIAVAFSTTLGQLSQPEPVLTNAEGRAEIKLTSTEAGVAEVTARVDLDGHDDWHTVINGSPVQVTFHQQDLRLGITQQVQPVYAHFGEPITFQITVTNLSGVTQQGINIIDHLPPGFVLDQQSLAGGVMTSGAASSLSGAAASGLDNSLGSALRANQVASTGVFDAGAHTITWVINSLAPGAAMTFTFTGAATDVPDGAELQNYVMAQAEGFVDYAQSSGSVYVGNWPALEITKTAHTATASVGDMVGYTVVLENSADVTTPVDSAATYVVDQLPVGFVYLAGSTRFDGQSAPDPTVAGNKLVWSVGDMPVGAKRQIEYATAVSIAAMNENGVNIARAGGIAENGTAYVTDAVEARVTVQLGLFGADGMILGSVFVDSNNSGARDADELGVAGAKLVTDTGIEITTDEYGLFSLQGLYPGVHALKLISTGPTFGDARAASGQEPTGGGAGIGARADGTVALGAGATQVVQVPVSGITTIDFAVAPSAHSQLENDRGPVGAEALTVGIVDVNLPLQDGIDPQVSGAFFTQHTFKPGIVVTARYTSRPKLEATPAAFPAGIKTGDRSQTRDLAPSQDQFYLKLQAGAGTLMYGDYLTPTGQQRFMAPSGRLTGWLASASLGIWDVAAFTSSAQWTQLVDEIAAEGVSGPYQLKNRPLAGSETVWLVGMQHDQAMEFEVARTLLTPDVDYTLDPTTGSLWFSRPIPGVNSDGTSNVIVVQYRTLEGIASSAQSGLRLNIGTGSRYPLGVTWQKGVAAGIPVTTLGVDGTMQLGETTILSYELAGQSDQVDRGTALHLELQTSIWERFNVNATVDHVAGTVRKHASTLVAGFNVRGGIEYRLREHSTLMYSHSFQRTAAQPGQHQDTLTLQLQQNDYQHVVELRSSGESGLPDLSRAVTLRLGTEWRITPGQVISMMSDLPLGGGASAIERILIPARASYRLALTDGVDLAVSYEATGRSGEKKPQWVLSLGTNLNGQPQVYGRYQIGGAAGSQDEVRVGLRHAWRITPAIKLAVNAEHKLATSSSQATGTLAWSASYTGLAGQVLALQHELVAEDQVLRHTVTASAAGDLAGFSYALSGRSHDPAQLTARETLVLEWTGSLAYRDQNRSRHTLLAQAFSRQYRRLTAVGVEDQRQVNVYAIDWAYRLGSNLRLASKVAVRQPQRNWVYPDGSATAQSMDTRLYQLTLQVPVGRRFGVAVFGRRVVDGLSEAINGYASELQFHLTADIALGVGYSSLGITDPDLQLVAPWSEGIYLNFQKRF